MPFLHESSQREEFTTFLLDFISLTRFPIILIVNTGDSFVGRLVPMEIQQHPMVTMIR